MRTTEEILNDIKRQRPDVTLLEDYTSMNTSISLLCECGYTYSQKPSKLLKGQKGCPVCGNGSNNNQTTETFIIKANKVHNDFYIYEKTLYTKSNQKVIITCKEHGDFEQTPRNHLSGQGCPKCAAAKKKNYVGWTYTSWEDAGIHSPNFDGYKLYIIRCFSAELNEEFYKIGKTFVPIWKRFAGNKIPYEYEVITIKEGSARFISELETTLHTRHKEHKYTPINKFDGCNECYNELLTFV